MKDVDALNIGGLFVMYKTIGLSLTAIGEVLEYCKLAGLKEEEATSLAIRAQERLEELGW